RRPVVAIPGRDPGTVEGVDLLTARCDEGDMHAARDGLGILRDREVAPLRPIDLLVLPPELDSQRCEHRGVERLARLEVRGAARDMADRRSHSPAPPLHPSSAGPTSVAFPSSKRTTRSPPGMCTVTGLSHQPRATAAAATAIADEPEADVSPAPRSQ